MISSVVLLAQVQAWKPSEPIKVLDNHYFLPLAFLKMALGQISKAAFSIQHKKQSSPPKLLYF